MNDENNSTTLLRRIDKQIQELRQRILQASGVLHDETPTKTDRFSCLNDLLDGSKLLQMTHKRSPFGPDYPYLRTIYEDIDGLMYRSWTPEPSHPPNAQQGVQQRYVGSDRAPERGENVAATAASHDGPPAQCGNLRLNPQGLALGPDQVRAEDGRLANPYYENGEYHWDPAPNTGALNNGPIEHPWYHHGAYHLPAPFSMSDPDLRHCPSSDYQEDDYHLNSSSRLRTIQDIRPLENTYYTRRAHFMHPASNMMPAPEYKPLPGISHRTTARNWDFVATWESPLKPKKFSKILPKQHKPLGPLHSQRTILIE